MKTTIQLKDGRALPFHRPYKAEERIDAHTVNLWQELAELGLKKTMPLEVEIGPGKGEYLARRAAAHPDRFFLGIDRRKDRFELTRSKLERSAGGKNWVLLRQDARSFLELRIPPVQILHVYHPDPWPKKRHHKHRFFRSPDAKRWAEALVKGGELRLSTDHRGYFEEIVDVVLSWGFLEPRLFFVKTAQLGEPLTHFEKIFLRKNEPVYKAVFIRLPDACARAEQSFEKASALPPLPALSP